MSKEIENIEQIKSYFAEENLRLKLWDIFHSQANKYADKLAIRTKTTEITFSELHQKANCIAESINGFSSVEQIGVGLLLGDAVNIASGMIGSLKSLNYFISLDPIFPNERLDYVIKDANIKVILTDTENLEKTFSLSLNEIKIINLDELNFDVNYPNPDVKYNLDDVVQICYTSGSTGKPKGVASDYLYLIRILVQRLNREKTISEDRLGVTRSFNFAGPPLSIMHILATGASFHHHYVGKEGLVGFADWINNEKITIFTTTPTIFRKFVGELDEDVRFPYVRKVGLGGEQVLKQDTRAYKKHFLKHSILAAGFGSTEGGLISYRDYPYNYDFKEDVLPVGYPPKRVEVYILDKDGIKVPNGEPGEVIISSDVLTIGYWNDPELTSQKYGINPEDSSKRIFRTGDLGKILPDGQIQHLGRIDNQVKIRGVRVEMNSVENHLLSYPGIKQAAAKSYLDKKGNKKLAGYLVPKPGVKILISDLRQFLLDKLILQMIPTSYIFLEKLPQTATGKVDRSALPTPSLSRPSLENQYVPPKSNQEKNLVKIWEDVIGVDGIGVTDNFFDLGGDSLSGVLLFLQVEKDFHMKLPLTILINASTIKQQVEILNKTNLSGDWSPIIPLKSSGISEPLFLIPGRGGYPLRFIGISKKLSKETPIYAMQAKGLDGMHNPFDTVEESAKYYIDEIKKIKPRGPYHLGGESGGGMIAYEMARQMNHEGEDVPILALFDTFGPGQTRSHHSPRNREVRFQYYFMLVKKHFNTLTKSNWEGRKEYIIYYFQLGKIQFQKVKNRFSRWKEERDFSDDLPPELKSVESATIKAIKKYYPKPLSGRVILFRAMLNPSSVDATNGWDQVDIGELVVHNMDCYHGNILFEPIEGQIADIINLYISEFETERITKN